MSSSDNALTLKCAWSGDADRSFALPAFQTPGAAGADIQANLPVGDREKGIVIERGGFARIPTGLIMEIPDGYEVQIRPRSGLAFKKGITVLNAPGTIDSDYRGEVFVGLVNLCGKTETIRHGDRIAQMVVAPVLRPKFVVATKLSETARGAKGFGSTGTRP